MKSLPNTVKGMSSSVWSDIQVVQDLGVFLGILNYCVSSRWCYLLPDSPPQGTPLVILLIRISMPSIVSMVFPHNTASRSPNWVGLAGRMQSRKLSRL
jgi:hypothetical protein